MKENSLFGKIQNNYLIEEFEEFLDLNNEEDQDLLWIIDEYLLIKSKLYNNKYFNYNNKEYILNYLISKYYKFLFNENYKKNYKKLNKI